MKMHNLQKRLMVIKHFLGDWKPVIILFLSLWVQGLKYKTVTEQVEQVNKRLELLDQGKLQYLHKKAAILNEELVNISIDAKDVKALGHNKDEVIF